MTNHRSPLRILAESENSDTAAPTGDIYGTVNASTLKLNGTTVSATAAELNRVAAVSSRLVAAGSALTLTVAAHEGKIILLDTLAGSTVTLPAATGSGARFNFLIKTVATSNSHVIKVANSSDTMAGVIYMAQDGGDTVLAFEATGTADTITLNRSTTGGTQKGEWVELIDMDTNVWAVTGGLVGTGTEATPFSAAV